MRFFSSLALSLAVAVGLFGCGSDSGGNSSSAKRNSSPAIPPALKSAEQVTTGDFPPAGRRTLQEVAGTVRQGPQIGLATSVLVPGAQRVAFGMIGADRKFLYGKTALYVARTPDGQARGPYPAPADSMLPRPAFLSRTAAADSADIKAIYAAQVPFPKPGRYAVLAVTRAGSQLLGAPTQVTVRRSSPMPDVGQSPPRVSTPTVASVAGNIKTIDTRVPPDDMHKVDFKDVVAKKPVVLLFSTPQLCQSRVCGPVTDLAVQLESEYRGRATFIHQEVYVDNEVNKGLRPQLRAFNLSTEPWLFTFNRQGKVAARLEGAFGVNAFRAAIEAALR